MFKNTFQTGCLSLLNSNASKPLAFWSKQVRTGRIKRVQDDELSIPVLEITANNIRSTFITCPRDPLTTLGIRLPIIVFQLRNIRKYVTFDVQVVDDRNVRRRFRASSMASTTKVGRLLCTLPLKLADGWNDVQINLAELTQRLYATQYVEATRLQVSASCRLRRVYFAERFHSDLELSEDWDWTSTSCKLSLTPRRGCTDRTRSVFDSCPPVTLSSAR